MTRKWVFFVLLVSCAEEQREYRYKYQHKYVYEYKNICEKECANRNYRLNQIAKDISYRAQTIHHGLKQNLLFDKATKVANQITDCDHCKEEALKK